MRIKLCENSKTGHHEIYLLNLLKIKNTQENFINKEVSNSKFRIFKFFFDRKNILEEYFKENNCIYHLLYLDNLYLYPQVFKLNKNRYVIATLHFVPQKRWKVLFLKNFAKKINIIIVHSEILKQKLKDLGVKNVICINYPSFYNYEKIETKKNIKNNHNLGEKIILTALGGTRKDKGLDILINSFNYINIKIKEKIILNIAGKEEDFNREFIREKAKEYKINLREEYGFLTDEKFMENVILTDIMIMPYRKIFGGNSGPMTEAIVNKIPCITPKGLNIGDLTEKYNLGLTFECENPKDLAKKIEDLILNRDKKEFFTTDFHEKLTVENFLKNYEEIYTKLERGEY